MKVLYEGVELFGVLQDSIHIAHQNDGNSKADFTIRGNAERLVLPMFGVEVEIQDREEGTVLFAGTIKNPAPDVRLSAMFTEVKTTCVGVEDALRGVLIQGAEGIAIVEEATAEEQFEALVDLLSGFTGSTDIGDGARIVRNIRYTAVRDVLRDLAARNDALLTVTPGKLVQLRKRIALPASAANRIMSTDIEDMGIELDSRQVRSRQFLRYGSIVTQRTVTGDGVTRTFLVGGTQSPVDYMEDGVAARALNAEAGDQGLRMRADADAEARTGGGIDFFGGNANAPGSGLYVGATLAGEAGISLAMMTNGRLQLRAGVDWDAAANYGIALRHDGTGTPLWTSDGITPTIETEGSDPVREAGSDFTLSGFVETSWARHAGTLFALHGTAVYGWRVVGSSLTRDSRFEVSLPFTSGTVRGQPNTLYRQLLVVGDRLYALYREITGSRRRVPTYDTRVLARCYAIGAGSLTRRADLDVAVAAPAGLIARNARYGYVNGATTYLSDDLDDWFAFDASWSRVSGSDYSISFHYFPSTANRGYWYEDGWIYRYTDSGRANNRFRRVNATTGAADATNIDLGTDVGQFGAIIGFGGLVFVLDRGASVSGNPGGNESNAIAVRVESEFLQWDAPAADYTTLNTRRQADSGFRVAVMDPDIIGVDVPGARFTPIAVDVSSVTSLTLNGANENIGDDEAWRFDVARQKIIQDESEPVLTAADSLVVSYTARAIAQACNPTASIKRDFMEDLQNSEGLTHNEASAVATEYVERFGELPVYISLRIKPGKLGVHFENGQTVQIETALLHRHGVSGVSNSDRWLITRHNARTQGNLFRYALGVQRGPIRERFGDWWRQFIPR